jgi:signal transduction histidine kinase
VFVRGNNLKIRRFIFIGATTLYPVLIMAVIAMMPDFLITYVRLEPSHIVLLAPDAYMAYCMLFTVYAGMALLLLAGFRAKRHSRKKVAQQTIMAWLIGFCLPVAAFFNLLLPLVGNYHFIGIGPILVLPVVAGFFYTIMKHSLFDIHFAIVRTVAYILSIATLAGIYLSIAYIISISLIGHMLDPIQNATNIVLVLVLAFTFQPIKHFFDHFTDRVFYRSNYNATEFFARLNRTLTSTTDLRTLLRRSAEVISSTLKSSQGFFFIYSSSDHYVSAGTTGYAVMSKSDARSLDDYVYKIGYRPLFRSSLDTTGDPIRRLMIGYKIELILPLVQDDTIIGYLCLGDQLLSKYTSRDIKVLGAISDELVIAIQNALSVQEVRELNATLQQRISAATKELRASNTQLRRLDEAKDEFVSMASHQLRTPLTSVKGYISMVLEGDAGKISDMQTHLLSEAFTSSERMVHLINDFLNVSRLQTGKFMVDKRPVDLANIVRQELDGLKTSATGRGLKFSYKSPRNFPMMNLDEGKIRQVIMNFSDNAMYYSREKSTIIVTLSIDGDTVLFTVKDTGIGVPKAEQAQLFSKFYRASNARKQRPDGTGVGLFLTKKVIDAHGGAVVFESIEGKGSTFGFKLPLSKLRVDKDDKLDDQPNDK